MNTESRNPKTKHIDKMSTSEMINIMQEENYNAVRALESAKIQIAAAIDAIFPGMKSGGRLIYVGCGTSGRLGVLDASECPPTFGVSSDVVTGIIAGGKDALIHASEGTEDSADSALADIAALNLSENDSVVGISASGNAGYVVAATEYAKRIGCVTVCITSNADCALTKIAKYSIVTPTGAEVIAGSTRMKAGTAQKLVLNMLSTSLMIKLGYVYENLMINLRPTNQKLKKRMTGIICEIAETDEACAVAALESAGWKIRDALELIARNNR